MVMLAAARTVAALVAVALERLVTRRELSARTPAVVGRVVVTRRELSARPARTRRASVRLARAASRPIVQQTARPRMRARAADTIASSRGGRAQTRTPNAAWAPRLRTVRKKVTRPPGRTIVDAAHSRSERDVRAAATLTPAGGTVPTAEAFAAVTAALLVRRPGSSARARTVTTTLPPAAMTSIRQASGERVHVPAVEVTDSSVTRSLNVSLTRTCRAGAAPRLVIVIV